MPTTSLILAAASAPSGVPISPVSTEMGPLTVITDGHELQEFERGFRNHDVVEVVGDDKLDGTIGRTPEGDESTLAGRLGDGK